MNWPEGRARQRLIVDFMHLAYRTAPRQPPSWADVVRIACQIGKSFDVTPAEVNEVADMTVRDLFP